MVSAASFVVLVDCGGGNSGAPNPDGGVPISSQPVALADLCSVFTDDLCAYQLQCNQADYRDLDHCRADTDCLGVAELTASSMQGGVTYDPSQVGACNARFRKDPCHFDFFLFVPNVFDVLADCPGAIVPQRRQGDACVSDHECVDGLYCRKNNETCPGACTPFAKSGDACPFGARCAADLFCSSGICRPMGADGAACASMEDCGPIVFCIDSPTCKDDNLWCDLAAGVCKKGVGVGASCGPLKSGAVTSSAECADGLWCDNVSDQTGVCRVFGGEGSPCKDFEGCDAGFRCAGYVPGGTGAALGKCTPLAGLAGACQINSDCQAGLRCLTDACVAPVAFGASCRTDADCQAGLACPNQRCVHARYPGDPCGDADSTCVSGLCRGSVCQTHAKLGQACMVGTDCATNDCSGGKCIDFSVCARR